MNNLLATLLISGLLIGFAPATFASTTPTQSDVQQQLISLLIQLINQLEAQLQVALAQQAVQVTTTPNNLPAPSCTITANQIESGIDEHGAHYSLEVNWKSQNPKLPIKLFEGGSTIELSNWQQEVLCQFGTCVYLDEVDPNGSRITQTAINRSNPTEIFDYKLEMADGTTCETQVQFPKF